MSELDLHSLAQRLAQAKDHPVSVELSADEAKVIAAALLELASAQLSMALQRSLLESYDEDMQAIDHAAAGALEGVSLELKAAANTMETIDPEANARARATLIEQIRSARSIEHALTVVLRFALIAGRLG